MKRKMLILSGIVALAIIVGCSKEEATNIEKEELTKTDEMESVSDSIANKVKGSTTEKTEDKVPDGDEETESLKEEPVQLDKTKDGLSGYDSKHIEYARVWLQLGPNQDIDSLVVRHIKAGEPVNPEDETSVGYAEDIIQLSGTRLVDGSVTYSSNGNGTVDVYNVPLRWDGGAPVKDDYMKTYTQNVIDHPELVQVLIGKNEELINLIKKLEIH